MQRSSSVPRDLLKRSKTGSNIYDSARLMLRLRALDEVLDRVDPQLEKDIDLDELAHPDDTDIEKALETNQEIPEFHAFLQAQNIRRPDGIISAYLAAYKAALRGQTYANQSVIIDFVKGRECTCSEALKDLRKIDIRLGTSYIRRFDGVYAKVKPFPFLDLPAELRLEIYNDLLPPRPYFVIGWSDCAGRPLAEKALFQTCQQIRNEVSNNFYRSGILYMRSRLDGIQELLTPDLSSAYSTIEQMGPHNRQFFETLEVQVDLPYHPNPSFLQDDSVQNNKFASILTSLPNVKTIIFSFGRDGLWLSRPLSAEDYEVHLLQNSMEYFLSRIPTSVKVKWDFKRAECKEIKELAEQLMGDRGGLQEVRSIAAPLIEQRRRSRSANIDMSYYGIFQL